MRESLYTAGYLGLMPMLRARLEKVESVNAMPGGPLIVSGIVAGLLATVSTQPADTIKTRMQAFVDPVANPEYRSVVSTTKHIIRTEGVTTLFAGLLPRAFRIVCAVFILSGTRNTAIDVLENHRRRIRVVASDGETVQSDGALGLAEHADVERGSGSRDSFSRVSNP